MIEGSALSPICRADRAELIFSPLCDLGPVSNGWGHFRSEFVSGTEPTTSLRAVMIAASALTPFPRAEPLQTGPGQKLGPFLADTISGPGVSRVAKTARA